MLNLSWDASQWHNIYKIEKHITALKIRLNNWLKKNLKKK